MLRPESVYQEITTALHTAHNGAPALIKALRFLGVQSRTISDYLDVSPSLVSFWSSGKEPLSPKHHPKLIELLRIAYQVAIQELGKVAATANPPELERNFKSYRDCVQRAGEILEELHQQ